MIRERIIEIANLFIGLEEKEGNSGFLENQRIYDSLRERFPGWEMSLEELFISVGWRAPQPWCMYAAEAIWKLAYTTLDSTYVSELDKVFSGSAIVSYNNFLKSPFDVVDYPEPAAIVIFQTYTNGKAHWTGHAGVVTEVNPKTFKSVEGNTTKKGEREGTVVGKKTRKVNYSVVNGLRTKGFIIPREV